MAEALQLASIDSGDWDVSPETGLVCRNAGKWHVTAQFQMIGNLNVDNAGDANLFAWFKVNGLNLANSAASGCCSRAGDSNVLVVDSIIIFGEDDHLDFVVLTPSSSGKLAVQVQGRSVPGEAVYAPSMILTLSKLD